MNLKILNSKGKKKILEKLVADYGVGNDLFAGYEVLKSGSDVWITSRECLLQDLDGLDVDSVGLRVLKNNKPTINGLQLLFKNMDVAELSEIQAKDFINGKEVDASGKIVSYKLHPLDLTAEVGGRVKRLER